MPLAASGFRLADIWLKISFTAAAVSDIVLPPSLRFRGLAAFPMINPKLRRSATPSPRHHYPRTAQGGPPDMTAAASCQAAQSVAPRAGGHDVRPDCGVRSPLARSVEGRFRGRAMFE